MAAANLNPGASLPELCKPALARAEKGQTMIRWLRSFVCRWRGHRYSKPFDTGVGWFKICRICGDDRLVKRRQPKVRPVAEQLTGALARNFGEFLKNRDAP